MATIVNTKLGEHRGKKRVWLEGQKLLREGYYPGMKYDLELKDSQVVLRVKDEGKFTVSKRERNGRVYPIIDLTAQELATVFDGVEMLRVFICNGAIVISAHHQQERVIERVNRLISKLENGESLSVCSLFHGGGLIKRFTPVLTRRELPVPYLWPWRWKGNISIRLWQITRSFGTKILLLLNRQSRQ
ncbi:hypothetical protein ACY3XD_002576 [Vibrio cholerae]